MAGSRLERFGTVFTRVRDLLRSGVMKPKDKPIWYDVYKAFPPKRDPVYVKPYYRSFQKREDTVREIFYREDVIRSKFYEQYGSGPRAFDLSKANFVSTCQRFVDKYTELESLGELDEDALFQEAGKALLAEGIVLRRRTAIPVSAESRNPGQDLTLSDMLAEEHSTSADTEETTTDSKAHTT